MATCFIFAQKFDEEGCLCLLLDQDGRVAAPLAMRTMDDVRALQMNARTILVLPTETSSLHEVELPWLGERKARAAIPYALEEELAQNVSTLHFTFDRQHYQNNRYLVVITDKQFLVDLIAKLDTLNIHFDVMTLDWFALNENEACVTENGLLIRDKLFKGALSGELATLYLNNQERDSHAHLFSDSMPLEQNLNITPNNNLTLVWIAQRLLKANMMSLCQGELQHGTRQEAGKQWYRACAGLFGALLVSILLMNAVKLHLLNTKNADLDSKIAVIYHEFFPNSSQVISPKFRIEQLLKGELANGEASSLWILLDKFAQAFKASQFTIEQFRYQGRTLSVTLVGNNFAELESLQLRLQKANVSVTQSQASSHENHVVATLELSL